MDTKRCNPISSHPAARLATPLQTTLAQSHQSIVGALGIAKINLLSLSYRLCF